MVESTTALAADPVVDEMVVGLMGMGAASTTPEPTANSEKRVAEIAIAFAARPIIAAVRIVSRRRPSSRVRGRFICATVPGFEEVSLQSSQLGSKTLELMGLFLDSPLELCNENAILKRNSVSEHKLKYKDADIIILTCRSSGEGHLESRETSSGNR